jgi:hypothetical protein
MAEGHELSGEARGEWLCFDDEHIRVLASWNHAKRFCAKVRWAGWGLLVTAAPRAETESSMVAQVG